LKVLDWVTDLWILWPIKLVKNFFKSMMKKGPDGQSKFNKLFNAVKGLASSIFDGIIGIIESITLIIKNKFGGVADGILKFFGFKSKDETTTIPDTKQDSRVKRDQQEIIPAKSSNPIVMDSELLKKIQADMDAKSEATRSGSGSVGQIINDGRTFNNTQTTIIQPLTKLNYAR